MQISQKMRNVFSISRRTVVILVSKHFYIHYETKFLESDFIDFAVLLGAAACQKQNESEIHDTVVIKTVLKATTPATLVGGGTDAITIFATCDWSVECEDWFTVEPATGGQGISESVITTQPNTTGADRTGTITLKAGTYSGTYTFVQAGK